MAATALTLGAAGVAAASPAYAANSPSAASPASLAARHAARQQTFVIPARAGTFKISAGSTTVVATRNASVRPLVTISCTLSVFNPTFYEGEPYGEGVYGAAEIECTNDVSELAIEVGLDYGGTLVSENSNYSYDSNLVSVVTDYPYSEGYYTTLAVGDIYYPSGYSPATGSVSGESPDTFVDL